MPFSNRIGKLIKIMCEEIDTLAKKAREQRHKRSNTMTVSADEKQQDYAVLEEMHLRNTHWKTVSEF